jgi:hypothetical protein
MPFYGNTPAEAQQAYFAQDAARRAELAQAIQTIVNNRRQQQAINYQQQQDALNRQLSQEQLRREALRDAMTAQWHQDEVARQNAALAEQKRQFDIAEADSKANPPGKAKADADKVKTENERAAGDAQNGQLGDPEDYEIPPEHYALHQQTQNQYEQIFGKAADAADAGNRLAKIKDDAAAVKPVANQHWYNFLWNGVPAASVMQPTDAAISKRAVLANVIAAAQKGGAIVQDPRTGQYVPAMPAPRRRPVAADDGADESDSVYDEAEQPAAAEATPSKKPVTFKDKTGKTFKYTGTASDPTKDRNPDNWELVK